MRKKSLKLFVVQTYFVVKNKSLGICLGERYARKSQLS